MTGNTLGIHSAPSLDTDVNNGAFRPPTRPAQRQPFGSEARGYPSESNMEPPSKKQRLDHGATVSVGTLLKHRGAGGHERIRSPRPCAPASFASEQYSTPHLKPSSTVSPRVPLRAGGRHRQQEQKQRQNAAIRRSLLGPGEVQIKPFLPETPSLAPRYVSSSYSRKVQTLGQTQSSHSLSWKDIADFTPWAGDHEDDVLSESTVKQGFYDKIQISQTESSTARPAIWSFLKHQSGLQGLSSLVVSVLGQRQVHNTATASCTFKPPPRVTLTDGKREAWLRDLANPAVPLRRLSRTIPHGIRGRALLDQCLSKSIPVARSLWLAKCVGANEIRAFKRKGASGAFAVGGEIKWMRDWTANVEQFLEAVIDNCHSGWKQNIMYCLELASHLSAEGLLDREHYFDWLLGALEHSDLDTLSVYLLIARTHLIELGMSRRFSYKLAASLLEQLHKIQYHSSPDLYDVVENGIVNIIRTLVVSSPTSFLLPQSWHKYESTLRKKGLIGSFRNICKRNNQLRAMAGADQDSELKIQQIILKTLDSTLSTSVDITQIVHELRGVQPDASMLVQVCLEWSASLYRCRYGKARVYLVARLLRELSGMGIDIEIAIFDFIAITANACDLDLSRFYEVVADLVRLQHFSVGRYLQWVMANGILSQYDPSDVQQSCGVGLIFALPLDEIPLHIQNLRQNLLRSAGISIDNEKHTIAQTKAIIDEQLQNEPEENSSTTVSAYLSSIHPRESVAVKSSVGRWIRHRILVHQESLQAKSQSLRQKRSLHPQSSLDLLENIASFRAVIRIVEGIDDYVSLATLLKHASLSNDARILTLVTITIAHHLNIFAAIGIADQLFTRIFQQQATLKAQDSRHALLEALIDLAKLILNRPQEIHVLQYELQKSDMKSSVAACSPISEHMVETLQLDDTRSMSASAEEVEQLLISGTSMDTHLLSSVFEIIWKRFELSWDESVQSSAAAASLLSRLRTFDTQIVTGLTQRKIGATLSLESRPKLIRIGMPLVCARSISLEHFLDWVLHHLQASATDDAREGLLIESLDLVMANKQTADSSIDHHYYIFSSQQERSIQDRSPVILSLLWLVLRSTSTAQAVFATYATEIGRFARLLSMLQMLLDSIAPTVSASDLNSLKKILTSILAMHGTGLMLWNTGFSTLIAPERYTRPHDRLQTLLQRVGLLNLPSTSLYLQVLIEECNNAGEDTPGLVVAEMLNLVATSSTLQTRLWAGMISALPYEQRIPIRNRAEQEFFALLANDADPRLSGFQQLTQCLLTCLNSEDAHDAASATRVLVQIHESLAQQIACLHPLKDNSISRDATRPSTVLKFTALLQTSYIHESAFHAPEVSDAIVTQILVLLSLLVVHPFSGLIGPSARMSNDVCDFLVTIIAYLSPTLHTRCIQELQYHHHISDSRFEYIYGSLGVLSYRWIQLVTRKTTTRKAARQIFSIHRWESLPDATPLMTDNDTSVSLTLFGARKAVL